MDHDDKDFDFLEDAVLWISKRHGGNIMSYSFHGDESNLHAHVVVLPVIEKTVKWNKPNMDQRN